jgi:hypothetical protein
MGFPNVTWAVLREIGEVVLIQWLASVAAYGYALRPLGTGERMLFGVAAALGFVAMTIGESAAHWYWHYALWSLTAALTAWMIVTRDKMESGAGRA